MTNLWIVFLTGLTVGGLTCLAVQGGLLASVIAAKKPGEEITDSESERKQTTTGLLFPTGAFLVAKLVAYTLLGFLLGAFGSAIAISPTTQVFMQFTAGIYMVAVALHLLDVHPLFRYVVFQPPKFLTKQLRHQSRSTQLFAPAILGAMTIFIPCGTTLAMQALAISSANPWMGAAIMAAFVLGTTPLFVGIGWITSHLSTQLRGGLLKVAAIAVFFLGLSSINGSLVASGSVFTIQNIAANFWTLQTNTATQNNANIPTNQNPEITVTAQGYFPSTIRVKKGQPVNLKLTSKDAYSCASAFRIPSLGISRNLQPNETQIITFTPQQPGKIAFSCSMGMYAGVIEVL